MRWTPARGRGRLTVLTWEEPVKRTRCITVVLASVAFALLSTPVPAAAQRERPNPKTLIGKPAPTFALQTVQGKDMNLAKERGNVVVLDFWATWCPPCRESLPGLEKLHADKELADQ